MDFENENKQDGQLSEQGQGGREGYQSDSGNYSKDYRGGQRMMRPRIHTQRAYSSERNNDDEGGFRPEGFGAGLQSGGGQRPYRPRYNNNMGDRQQGGYQPRQQGGYQPRQQGGYQPRQQGG